MYSTTRMASNTILSSSVLLVWCLLLSVDGVSTSQQMGLLNMMTSLNSSGEAAAYTYPRVCWCGPNTDCWFPSDSDAHQCACKSGYEGIPPKCRPAPELWRLCFEDNPCGIHGECEVNHGTWSCPYCVLPAVGSPPRCVQPDQCRHVEKACGPNAECDALYFQPCFCAIGFVGKPPNCTAGPTLLALCDPYPCGAYSDCHMQDGRPVCKCARGYVGTPPRCEPSAEMWRVCFKDKPCGQGAKCDMVDRVAVCSACQPGYSGEPPRCYETVTGGGLWPLS